MKYAGFDSLADYLTQRCARHAARTKQPFNLSRLGDELGFRKTYLYSVRDGLFLPSRDRLKQIAQFFGDDPRSLYILGDLEDPPAEPSERDLRELLDIAAGLSASRRKELLKFATYLKDKP